MIELTDEEKAEVQRLENEIKEVESALADTEAEIQGIDPVARKKEQLELTKRKAADAAIIKQLTLKHGPKGKAWDVLETGPGLVAIAKPSGPLSRFYTRWCDDGQPTKKDDLMKLNKPCLLHPSVNEYEKICELEPATPMRSTNLVCSLAGARAKDLEGK